jgi:hypothetical protein
LPSPAWEFVHAHQQPRKHDLPGQRLPGLSDARLRLVVQLLLARSAVETVREARRSAGLLQMRRVRSERCPMLAAFVLGMTLVLAAIVTDVLMAIRRLRVGDIVHRSIIAIWGGWFLWDRLRSGETLWAGLPLWAEATLVTRLPVAGLAYLVWALRHARRECAKHVSGNAH